MPVRRRAGHELGEVPPGLYREPRRLPPSQAPVFDEDEDVRAVSRNAQMVNYPLSVPSTGNGLKALVTNKKRKYLFLQNHSAADTLYVNYDSPSGPLLIRVGPLASYEWLVAPTNSIWLKASANTIDAVITEGA